MTMGPSARCEPSRHGFAADVAAEVSAARAVTERTSGGPFDKIFTRQNRDFPADRDLCFERGIHGTDIRIAPADRPALLEAVGSLVPELSPLLARGDALARQGVPEEHGRGFASMAKAVTELVLSAHAVGYRLACDDIRATHEDTGFTVDFLLEKLAWERQRAGDGPDTAALERVIALLSRR